MHRELLGVSASALLAFSIGCSEPQLTDPAIEQPSLSMHNSPPRQVVVDPDGRGDVTTIQEGIDLVRASGRVLVRPGTYQENVSIDKGVELRATKRGAAIIAPAGGNGITVSGPDRVRIRGMKLDSDGGFTAIRGNGPVDLSVERVTILGWQRGIEIGNTGTGSRARLRVTRTTIDGGPLYGMSTGIFVVTDVDADITRSTFRHASFSCIHVQSSANAIIRHSKFEECRQFGIASALDAGRTMDVIGNTLRNTTASSAFMVGIRHSSGNGRVERNRVIEFTSPAATALAAGILSQNADVRYNDISGNAGLGLEARGPIDATCNWWGSADGPSGDGPGTGDAVSGPADFTPFSTKPIAHRGKKRCFGGL